MEQCAWMLIELFQDIDLMSLFSQLFLEDTSSTLNYIREDEKLVMMIDQFCDITLKSFCVFLEHRSLNRSGSNSKITSKCKNLSNIPKDIPTIFNRIQQKLSEAIPHLNKMRSNNLNRDERVYFTRLIRFLSHIKQEIKFFTCHEDLHLLYSYENEIHIDFVCYSSRFFNVNCHRLFMRENICSHTSNIS